VFVNEPLQTHDLQYMYVHNCNNLYKHTTSSTCMYITVITFTNTRPPVHVSCVCKGYYSYVQTCTGGRVFVKVITVMYIHVLEVVYLYTRPPVHACTYL
jgi:hypothetical protein